MSESSKNNVLCDTHKHDLLGLRVFTAQGVVFTTTHSSESEVRTSMESESSMLWPANLHSSKLCNIVFFSLHFMRF